MPGSTALIGRALSSAALPPASETTPCRSRPREHQRHVRHRVDEHTRGHAVRSLHFQYIGSTFGRLCGADPSKRGIARQQQRDQKPADFTLQIAALKLAQTLLGLRGQRSPAVGATCGGPATCTLEPADAATSAEVAAADLGGKLGAVENLLAIDPRASTATADGERLVAPELVGQLEDHLGVAIEREVAIRPLGGPVDLQSLDGCELVLTAKRRARIGKYAVGLGFFRLLTPTDRLNPEREAGKQREREDRGRHQGPHSLIIPALRNELG